MTPARRTPAASKAAQDDGDENAASLRAVGTELRRIRRNAGLSLRDLGRLASLTPGFLSLVERGECSLSLTSLFALSKALGVPAADLVQGGMREHERSDFAFWPAPGTEPAELTIGEREYWQLNAAFPGRQLAPLRMRIQPTQHAAPLSSHDGEEFAYILSGVLSITLRDKELRLEPGSALHFRSVIPHTISNHTSQPVDALWVVTAEFWHHN
jgi:transcriptional regulator with XRE-family HTH domain